jgi:hypothetical protein
MAARGLFTLDSATRGVLGTDVLGGTGTGFVEGVSSSTGTATGAVGRIGTVSGTGLANGSAMGAVGFAGTVAGVSTSTGTATGTENDQGIVVGVSVSTGTATGFIATVGSSAGVSVAVGAVTGGPATVGTVSGVSTSTGTASGSPDGPPPPPEPDSGAKFYVPEKMRFKPTHRTGGAVGKSDTRNRITGICARVGYVRGSQSVYGRCSGIRYPSDELIRKWARTKRDSNELILLGEM